MSLAKNMLVHSSKNISEIADYLGFTDMHYFSRFIQITIADDALRLPENRTGQSEKQPVSVMAEYTFLMVVTLHGNAAIAIRMIGCIAMSASQGIFSC